MTVAEELCGRMHHQLSGAENNNNKKSHNLCRGQVGTLCKQHVARFPGYVLTKHIKSNHAMTATQEE